MYDEEKMQPFVDYLLSLIIKYADVLFLKEENKEEFSSTDCEIQQERG